MNHPVNQRHHGDDRTFGERVADRLASGIGSWTYLSIQGCFIACWMTVNSVALLQHWDPFPWILLNLCLSLQAAYTGPILLLAGKRQAAKDRDMAEHDFQINQHSEEMLESVLQKIDENTSATLKIIRHLKVDGEETS